MVRTMAIGKLVCGSFYIIKNQSSNPPKSI
jgi:hypothetical protein